MKIYVFGVNVHYNSLTTSMAYQSLRRFSGGLRFCSSNVIKGSDCPKESRNSYCKKQQNNEYIKKIEDNEFQWLTLSPTSWPSCLINCLTWSSVPAIKSSWWWASKMSEIQSTSWPKSGWIVPTSPENLQSFRSWAKCSNSLMVDLVVNALLMWLRSTTSE